MNTVKSYRSTVTACYTANFIGALVINLTPVLFVPLKLLYDLSYTQFGILLAVNYCTQVAADLIFSAPVDRFGSRPFAVTAPVLTVVGYALFALSPVLWEDPFGGFVAGTVLFSATGGMLEVLLNVIINGIPGDQKNSLLSVLHSFYAWGQLTVVLLTTLALWFFGAENWQFIVAAWAVLPVINTIQFATCAMPPEAAGEDKISNRELMSSGMFYLLIAIIIAGGMTEVTVSLWISPFLERAVNFPKITGDLVGVCLASIMLGSGRLMYGLYGQKWDIWRLMVSGSVLAFFCYLLAAFSPLPSLSLAGCVLATLGASLLWPGTVVLSARQFPGAGAWLFALLAFGGDSGAAAGPFLVGVISDYAGSMPLLATWWQCSGLTMEQFNLRAGMGFAALFPLLTCGLLLVYRKWKSRA
ncbi:MAG: MFS transporter [Lentisphaeria bacterium]|nr:MFS transporter [Lentisphaeria bacterium]